ncbi:MAG: electron transfer flavoprotein subunit beta/FixA family protein [Elusimicrobiales bacterium]
MNIFVCVKQVPDTTEVKINPQTGTLIRSGVPSILNPYDHFALVSAVKLKKEHPHSALYVISMGPPQAKAVIQLSLALGADAGYLISDPAFAGSDTWATSYTLALAIKKIAKPDIVICGMQAIDGDTAQVGPGISAHLSMPIVAFCDEISVKGRRLEAKKHIDDGYDIVECDLPCVVTMVKPKDFELPFPSFVNIVEAVNKKMLVLTASDISADPSKIGLKGSPTQVARIYPPKKEINTVFINTTSLEAAARIVDIMRQENFIK